MKWMCTCSLVCSAFLVGSAGCGRAADREGSAVDGVTVRNGMQPREYSGVSPLVEAINAGDVEKARALLKAGTNPNESNGRRSAMGSAIAYFKDQKLACNLAMVRILLDHGADPNKIDPIFGSLPLHDALALGDLACVDLLRMYGAKPDADPRDSQASMTYAVKGAISTGNLKVLEVPISWGVDPSVRGGGRGWTALYEAVFHDNIKVVKVLLALGVNPCIRDSGGGTALDYARAVGASSDIVDALAKATKCSNR